MSLNRLEIHNFKSYKGTHVIGPLDRFSCIVGPNGSGKSNILDAISFVLNVPNIYLRAKHLKNLIEYGSNEAYVRIHIGNKVFERRVIKTDNNGLTRDFNQSLNRGADDSVILDASFNQDFTQSTSCKYSIDGIKVTQRQYNIELEHINILTKIRNFVIYQGDIIKTDVDLLKMIENVCGSDVYIEEYKELNDKITVLNKDLNIKYEKRKDCLEMMKEMKEVEEKTKAFESLVIQKDEIQRKIYELEIKQKKTEITKIKDALKTLEQMKEDERYNEVLSNVNKLRSEAARLQKEYFEKETELVFLKSKQNGRETVDVESKINDLKTQQEAYRKLNEELNRMALPVIFDENTILNGESVTRERFEMLLNEKEREYLQRTSELEKNLSELTLKNFDKINRRDYLQNNIKQMNTRMHKMQSRNEEIEKENTIKQEKIRSIDKEIQQLENQIKDKASTYDKIITDEEKLNKELNDVMREILLNKAKKSDTARKSMIKNVIENLKTIFSGVHGRVIDLIEPIQKKYELSVGVLLSKHDQSVIVDNEKTAMDCLRYIKDSKSCKLTFLPLNKIKPYFDDETENNTQNVKISSEILEFKENLATKCIRYSEQYEDVISFIFKNSLIIDTVDRAKHILYSRRYPGKICTLDGILFTPEGLITGGRTVSNKFEDDIIDHLLSKRKTILNDIKMNKDRKEAYSDITVVKMKIEDLKNKRQTIKLENVERIDVDDFNIDALRTELRELEENLKEFELRQRTIKESKKQIEKSIFSGILNVIGMNSLQEYKEKIKESYRRQEIVIKMESVKDKIAVLNEEIAASVGVENEKRQEKDLNQMESEINKLYNNLETVKEKLKTQNQVLKNYSEKRNQLNNSILNHQLHLTRTEEDLKDIIKYAELESNYKEELPVSTLDKMSLTHSSNRVDEIGENLETLKVKIEEINRLITQNVTTLSSVDSSIQNKFSRLNREYEIAKEELLNIKRRFQEVKNLRMEAFSRCFTVISSEITEIYRNLTVTETDTNSNAYLVYEGDPFSNNVKYYLMPPSKRFIPFQELSGGERSIALLSFIFALSRFKRPPFYIFDEVDSALDKNNVERLSKYILDSEDQFLLISLKPQFFSKSQSLFGVYKCPFNNTSKVLSYKLE